MAVQRSPEVNVAGKAYLKITQVVKAPLHELNTWNLNAPVNELLKSQVSYHSPNDKSSHVSNHETEQEKRPACKNGIQEGCRHLGGEI